MIKDAKSLLQRRSDFREGLRVLLQIRDSILRPDETDPGRSLYGALYQGLTDADYSGGVNKKSRTIAYGIWHSTRIEDMTMNRLVLHRDQVFDRECVGGSILEGFRSTGNELDGVEILDVSRRMDVPNLLKYQSLVWRDTNARIMDLTFEDLSRKVSKHDLDRLLDDGSVSRQESAVWLIDFWGSKTVAGLLMMPMCRHHVVHLNESMEAKAKGKRPAKA